VVFPELALTTFFPRHYNADIAEADRWFEPSMPSNETAALFDAARKFGVGFHLGYAAMVVEQENGDKPCQRRFNTSILVSPDGEILLKYRKVHLPGQAEYDPRRKVQHLEKRYFEVGNLGFPVIRAPMGSVPGTNMGVMICNEVCCHTHEPAGSTCLSEPTPSRQCPASPAPSHRVSAHQASPCRPSRSPSIHPKFDPADPRRTSLSRRSPRRSRRRGPWPLAGRWWLVDDPWAEPSGDRRDNPAAAGDLGMTVGDGAA
jgi:hypothetical protein